MAFVPAAALDRRYRPARDATSSRGNESVRQFDARPSVSSAFGEEKKSTAGQEATVRNDGSDVAASQTRELPLAALRTRGSAVKKEENDYPVEAANEGQSGRDPASIKKAARPNVDIDGLRRAINESLRKQNENNSRPAATSTTNGQTEKKKAEAEQRRPDVASRAGTFSGTFSNASDSSFGRDFLPNQGVEGGRESSQAVIAQTDPPRIVRLSVPIHEDLDARRQIGRELSKLPEKWGLLASGVGGRSGKPTLLRRDGLKGYLARALDSLGERTDGAPSDPKGCGLRPIIHFSDSFKWQRRPGFRKYWRREGIRSKCAS